MSRASETWGIQLSCTLKSSEAAQIQREKDGGILHQ